VISPLALEAVRRIDALFDIERTINGQSAERRRQVRQEASASLAADLERWLREERPKLSRGNDLAKAMDYLLKRWPAFTRFLDDGRICLSNNAASEHCAVSLSAENRGCSQVPIAAESERRRCTA
jgi:transposase